MRYTIFLFISLLFVTSCTSDPSSSQQESETTTTTETVVAPSPKNLETNTLEGFWNVFQIAVNDKDYNKISSLFTPEASTRKFQDEDYKFLILTSNHSDIVKTNEEYQGKKVYEFQMVLPMEEEQLEASTTTIYIIQNDTGNFRIFNVLEAG